MFVFKGCSSLIKVLIVDDEKTIREGIKGAINWVNHGMKVVGLAASGIEAINALDNLSPDVVLLDIVLNDMDGLEILQIIRNKYSRAHVIMISGYDEFEYARRAMELNAHSYLLKPLDTNQLDEKLVEIKEAIDERRQILKKNEEINRRLVESFPIIKDNLFYQLIKGRNLNLKTILDKGKFLGIEFNKSHLAVIVLELYNNDHLNEYDRNLIRYAVIDICENSFPHDMNPYVFNLDDKIGIMICGNDLKQKELLKISNNIIKNIIDRLNISLTMGIGGIFDDLLMTHNSYQEAINALDYRIIMGLNKAIDAETIYKSTNKTIEISPIRNLINKREDELKYALKTMNQTLIDTILKDIISVLYSSIKKNIKNYNRELIFLSNFFTEIAIELDLDIDEILKGEELFTKLRLKTTIEEIEVSLAIFLKKITEILKNKQESNNSIYVRKAIEYIDNNINEDISLTKVAESLYISSNYLSRIFKQETGESFIEYVVGVKMYEAKKLLENSTKKIYEIADLLNYKDVNYFTKTFKRFYGVTPSECRDLV